MKNLIITNLRLFRKVIPDKFLDNGILQKIKEINETEIIVKILSDNNISLALDVGANQGFYTVALRELGFNNRIIAFEPIKKYAKSIEKLVKNKANIEVKNFALGDKNESKKIHVASNNGGASSFLNPDRKGFLRQIKFHEEEVRIKKLDSIIDHIASRNERIFLKMDVQGFEKNVLKGSLKSFSKIHVIQTEVSFKKIYEKQPHFEEINDFLKKKGFRIINIIPAGTDKKTGELIEADIFYGR